MKDGDFPWQTVSLPEGREEFHGCSMFDCSNHKQQMSNSCRAAAKMGKTLSILYIYIYDPGGTLFYLFWGFPGVAIQESKASLSR